jgi:isocitrate dehydrogenase (NAD+)
MAREVALLRGDGIGPEVTDAAIRAIEAAGAKIQWVEAIGGAEAAAKTGSTLPDVTIETIKRTGLALKGPIGTPIGKGFRSVNVELRKRLDLYACLRRTRNVPGVDTPFPDVDIIVVRENTEGIYSGIEHEVVPGVVETLRIITEKASHKIAEFAFQLAKREGRKKVTALHKANIMKLGDGLFLRCCQEIAAKYPEIQYQEMIIDNACMQLVMRPRQFDVLVMENFHGDLISDLTAGLVGGTGVCGGSNIGEKWAVFEAIHGTAPDIAGKRLANPGALMICGVEMLRYMGGEYTAAGDRLEKAVYDTIGSRDKAVLTRDLKGEGNTDTFTNAVIARLQ